MFRSYALRMRELKRAHGKWITCWRRERLCAILRAGEDLCCFALLKMENKNLLAAVKSTFCDVLSSKEEDAY